MNNLTLKRNAEIISPLESWILESFFISTRFCRVSSNKLRSAVAGMIKILGFTFFQNAANTTRQRTIISTISHNSSRIVVLLLTGFGMIENCFFDRGDGQVFVVAWM